MKKFIRWGGLIPFVGICAVMALFWNFYVDKLVEYVIEDQGSKIVGAKVELDAADLTLLPLGVTLTRLQVTNPRDYAKNAVEIKAIHFDMEPLELLRRKVIVNNMTMLGMQFGTERAYPGDIPHAEKYGVRIRDFAKEEVDELELPSFEIPDVKKILEEEDLETLRIVKEVREEIETEKATWEKRIKELPNAARFKEYETRIKKLQSAKGPQAILAAATDLAKIKKEIERDIESIKSAKNDVQGLVGQVQTRVKQAQQAPFNDIKHLRDKYGLSPEGLANLSNRLLGPKVAGLVREGSYYYQLASPYLKKEKTEDGLQVVKPVRAKGRDVRFTERRPLPDFLIKTADLDFSLDVGNFGGRAFNITGDQPVWGQPLTVGIAALKLKGVEGIAVDGTFDHTRPEAPNNTLSVGLQGYQARNVVLSKSKNWPVTLESGLADLTVKGTIAGDKLDFTIGSLLREAQIKTAFASKNLIAEAMADAIGGVKSFKLNARVRGELNDFDIALESDLDQILKQAVGSLVTKQMEKFEAQLREKIMAKVDGPLKDLLGNVGGFDDILGTLTDREKLGQNVLQMAIKQATGGAIPGAGKLPGGLKLPF